MENSAVLRLHKAVATYSPYVGGLVARGCELVGKLGLYMLAARILGAHEAGLYFLCLTWVGLAATIARAGFEKAAVRHISGELAIGQVARAKAALYAASGWVVLGGLTATLCTLVVAGPAAIHLFDDPDLARALIIAATAVLPQALCFFAGHVLIGYGRGVAGQWVQNASWPVFTLLAMLAGVHSLDGMLWALAASNLAAALMGAWLIARMKSISPGTATAEPAALPALWRTALPLGVVEVVQVALNSIPVLLLAVYASAADVGAFSIASRLSMLIWVVIISVGFIVAPQFSALHRRQEWDALRQQNRRARRLVALFGLPPIFLMMVFPVPLLTLVGPGFAVAASALVIMCIGQMINCLLPCQDVLLSMTGHGGLLRWLNAAQLLSCCVLGIVLIPTYGMTGAAILSAVVIAQGAIGTYLAVRHLMPRAL